MRRIDRPARLVLLTAVLTWFVIMLGAYVRLSDAGLGCPDWPGCYGQLIAPSSADAKRQANDAFPLRPVETHKAWKEMAHRYAAGSLGLMILAICAGAWYRRRRPGQPLALPTALLALVSLQALLGMWTVTELLKPAIVTLHLLGGMAILALLCWLFLRYTPELRTPINGGAARGLAALGLLVIVLQIALGGWTSTNYAAFFCADFPTCQGQWLPPADFAAGFDLWHSGAQDYEGGILSNDAGVAVHLAHRIGALLSLLVLGYLGLRTIRFEAGGVLRVLGWVLLAALAIQLLLGVANVLLRLPLPLAVAHNGVAAILLALVVAINYLLRPASGATLEPR